MKIFKKHVFTLEEYNNWNKKPPTEYSNYNDFANPWDYRYIHYSNY